MTWIVDTCVVIDILEADPAFGLKSAKLLQKHAGEGLAVSPISMVELAPAFSGDLREQRRFLEMAGISCSENWTHADTESAYRGWDLYVRARRARKSVRRPVADILIGAFASNRRGLITRNGTDFAKWFPGMTILEPD
jgi:hypothetical protein